ncbi:gliding motility-associated C-terminal domain-containing protein [Chitinophaga sp. MM2321]|uniref:T9SS type B sorting domain-containing protein n=1 Tax=Chitinophaga sp. MM2321 TaxID=3137178 RepID=UPI0032D59ECC
MKPFLSFLYLILGLMLMSVTTTAQKAFINAPDNVCKGSLASLNGLLWDKDFNPDHMDWSVSPALAPADYEMVFWTGTGVTPGPGAMWLGQKPNTTYPGVTAMTIRLKKEGTYTFTVKIYKTSNSTPYTVSKTITVQNCDMSACPGTISTMAGFKEDFGRMKTGNAQKKNDIIDGIQPAADRYLFGSGQLDDNYYAVYYNTQLRTEWVSSQDHTQNFLAPDSVGAMLVANSALEKKAFYKRTITGLCPGSIYSFSAWFMNVNSLATFYDGCARSTTSKPDGYHYAGVTFVLSETGTGKEIGRFNTYDVSMNLKKPEWQQYGGSFKTKLTSVDLTIINNNYGGCGNDIAIDDIEFKYCSPDIFAFVDGLKDEQRTEDRVCGGAVLDLTAFLNPIDYFDQPTYKWQISPDGLEATYVDIVDGPVNAGVISGATTPVLHFGPGALKGDPNVEKTYYYRVGITEKDNLSLTGCAAPSRPVKITILPQPQITITGSEICSGATATLTVDDKYDSYEWKVIPIVTGQTLTVSPTVTTTYEVVGEKSYGNAKVCKDSNRAEIVVYDPPVVNVSLLTPKEICLGDEVKLDIQEENKDYDIKWDLNGTLIPGETDVTLTHTPTTATTGAFHNIYNVTVTNGVCVVDDNMEVIVHTLPDATVGPDQVQCITSPTFTLTGNQPPAGQTGQWTFKDGIDNGATITNPALYNSTVTGLPAGKSVTLIWTITNDNKTDCADEASLTLTSLPEPVSDAGTAITQCGINTFQLGANEPGEYETGKWTVTAGSGVTFDDATRYDAIATMSATPVVKDVTLTWTVTNGKCLDATSTVILHRRKAPTLTATAAAVCNADNKFTITFSGLTGTVTEYTVKPGTPTPMPGFVAAATTTPWPTTGNTIVVDYTGPVAAGTYNFILSVQDGTNAGCTADIPFTVKLDEKPTVTITGNPLDICLGAGVTLSIEAANSTYTKTWKVDGVTVGTNSLTLTHTPSAPAGIKVYSVTVVNGTCTETVSQDVIVNAVPIANAGINISHCDNGTFQMAAVWDPAIPIADQKGEWSIVGTANGASITTTTDPLTTVTGLTAGTAVTLRWTVSNTNNSSCSNFADIVLTNTLPITVSVAGNPITQCGITTFQLSGNTLKTGETGKWTAPAGSGVTFDHDDAPNAIATLPATPTSQQVTLTWTISNGVCTATTSEVVLTLTEAPTLTIAPIAAVCNSKGSFNLAFSAVDGTITKYSIKADVPTPMAGFTDIVGATWTGVSPINVTYPSTVAAGTYNFTLTIQNGNNQGCVTVIPFSVKIDQEPTVAITGNPAEICKGTAVALSIDAANGAYTIQWTLNGVNVGTGTSLANTPTFIGDNIYEVTVTNGACSVTENVTVVVRSVPVANAGINISHCDNGTFKMAAVWDPAIPTADQQGKWSIIGAANGASITTTTDPLTTVTGLTAGTAVTLRWTVSNTNNSSCTDFADIVLTNTLPLSENKNGAPITQCGITTFQLSGSPIKTGETGKWTAPAGSGVTFDHDDAPDAIATLSATPTSQQVTLTWTVSNGVCTATTSEVVLTLTEAPTLTIAPIAAVCNSKGSFNLAFSAVDGTITKYSIKADVPTPMAGFTDIVDATWTGVSPINVTYPSTVAAGTYNFTLTIQNGDNQGCVTVIPFSVKIDQEPTVNITGNPAEICKGTAVALNIDAANGAYTIQWTLNGVNVGTGTSLANTPTSIGDNIYEVTVTNGACSVTENVTVVVRSVPVANAGINISHCDNGTFQMAAVWDPAIPTADQQGKWFIVGAANGATITTATDPLTTVTGLTAGTAVTLRWTVSNTNNSSCTDFADIVLTNTLPLSENKNGAPITQCGITTFQLSGSPIKTGETGKWTAPAGSGVTFDHDDAPNAIATLPATPTSQQVTLTWTISNGVCTATTSEVVLTLTEAPTLTIAPIAAVCNSKGSFNLAFSAVDGTITKYSIKADVPTPMAGFTNIVDATWTGVSPINVTYPSTVAAGTYNFTLTIQNGNNQGCVTVIPFSVKIDQEPTVAITGNPAEICKGTAVALNIDAANGAYTIQWTLNGVNVGTGTSLTNTPTFIGDNLYEVTVTNGACSVTENVTVVVRSVPVANAGINISHCDNGTFKMAAVWDPAIPIADQQGEWSIIGAANGATITTATDPLTTVTGLTAGTAVTLRWTVSNTNNSSCNHFAEIVLTNTLPLSENKNGAPITQCGITTFQLSGSPIKTGETGKWTAPAGSNVTFDHDDAPNAIATLPATPTSQQVTLTWTISNGVCTATTSEVVLTLTEAPTLTIAPIAAVCNSKGSFNLAFSAVDGTITKYSIKADVPTPMAGFTNIVDATWTGVSPINVTYPSTVAAGTYNFTLTIQNGDNQGCVTVIPFSVKIDQEPTVAITGAPLDICEGATVTFSIDAANTAPGYTIKWELNGNALTETGATLIHKPTKVGDNIYKVTVTNGACVVEDNITVTLRSMPVAAPDPGYSQCNVPNFNLKSTAPLTDQEGVWSFKGGINNGATITSTTSNNTTLTGLPAGKSVTLIWTVTNKGNSSCTSSKEVTFTNTLPLSENKNGAPITQCGITTFQLSGSPIKTGETGKWTAPAGSNVTFDHDDVPNAIATLPATPTSQQVTLTWTISNGVCTATTSEVVLTLTEAPTLTIAPIAAVCNSKGAFNLAFSAVDGTITKYSIKADVPTPMAGFTNIVDATWTGVSPINVTYPSTVAAGTYNFTLTIQNGNNQGCVTVIPFSVKIDQEPTVNITGNPAEICEGTAVALNIEAANSAYTIKWTLNGVNVGTGTSLANTPTFIGDNLYEVTVTNGACSVTENVTVVVRSMPEAKAGIDITQCDNGKFKLGANKPEDDQTGTWVIIGAANGATITTATDHATEVTGLTPGKSVTIRWIVTNNYKSTCTATDDIVLTNTPALSENKDGAPIIQCGDPVFQLSGSPIKTGETGKWTAPAGSNVTFDHDDVPNAIATLPATPTSQQVTLTWTISNGVCTATTSHVVLTLNEAPSLTLAAINAVCNSNGTFDVAFSNVKGNITEYSIKAAATKAMPGFTAITKSWSGISPIKVSYPTTTVAGTYNFVLTIRDGKNKGCTTDYNFSVKVQTPSKVPTSITPATIEICDKGDVKLTIVGGSLGTNENGTTNAKWQWYTTACPGTTGSTAVTPDAVSPDGRTATFKNVAVSTTYFVRAESTGACGSSACVSAKVTVYEKPADAYAGPDQKHCNIKTDLQLEGNELNAAGAVGTWTTYNARAVIHNPNLPTSKITLLPGDTATFTWTIKNGVCTTTSDHVFITNYETPATADANKDQENCNNANFTLNGNAPTQYGATGTWTYPTGTTGVTIANKNLANTTVTVAAGKSVTFTWTITNGTCAATSDQVVVTNYALAAKANAGPDQKECNKLTDFVMRANAPGVATGKGNWKDISRIPGRATIKSPTSPTTAVTVPVGDTAILQWSIANGVCDSTFSTVTIINYKKAATAVAGPDQEKCNSTTDFTMEANAPGVASATGTWTDISRRPGRATIKSPNDPFSKVTVPLGDTVILKWTISNGNCTGTSSTVTLINYAKAADAAAGSDQEKCNTTADFTMTADKPSVSSAKGFWSIVKGNALIRSINNPASGVNINIGDTVTLRWTVTNGVCSATSDEVTLINYQAPVAAKAGPNQEHCNDATFKMDASDPAVPGAKGSWKVTSSNAALISISKTDDRKATITVPAGETAVLTWTVSNGVCTATSSSVTLINRKPILGNTIQADQTVCTTEMPMAIRGNLLSGGNGTYTYVWQQNTAGATGPFTTITGATSDIYQPGLLAADTWYRRLVTSGACINNISNVVKITVVNKSPFVTSVPPAITTECVQGKDYTTLFGKPVFSHAPYDNVTLTVTYNDVTVVTSPCLSTITRTWTATDRCGLFVTASQTITIQDTRAPVFTTPAPANVTVDCDKVPAKTDLIAKDDCAGNITIPVVEVRKDIPGATCTSNYQLIRTWTAVDACNTGITLTQVITVKDMSAPVFNMQPPADATVDCDKIPAGTNLTASDNCTPGVITVIPKDSLVHNAGSCASNYIIFRKWTAMDDCGNARAVQQIIRVQDTTRPVFSMPAPNDTIVNCDMVPAWPVITATDNCSGNIQVFTSSKTLKLPGACAGNFLEIRTWTATDDCGNKTVMQQQITVQDTTKPVFTVKPPADTTVSCDNIPKPAFDVAVTDNCSTIGNGLTLSRQIVTESIPGACKSDYRIIRTWIAKDACGNIATMKQVVTVKDTTRPVIMPAPADVVIFCQDKIPSAPVLTATDNCDPAFPKKAIYSEDPFVKDICNGYTIIRRWTIMDACGNKANDVIQRVIIKPCDKPQLIATLPTNCSDNPRIALQPAAKVSLPTFTLVAVTPANVVAGLPLTQSSNIFNLNGATSASFIMTDGKTGCSSDTVTYDLNYIQKPVVNLGRDTTICGGNSLVLDAGAVNFAYSIKWSTGATTQRIKITQAGTYWVNVSNGQCITSDTIKVGLIPTPLVDIPDTTICRGQSVKLDAYVDGAQYLWSNGATTPSILVSTQEQFWVKVMKSACITIDTIKVSVNPPPDISLSRDTAICPDQSIMLTVNSNGGRIKWQTGETSNSIIVNQPGGYWVAVSRDNCVVRDTVNVRMKPGITLDLGPDRNICPDGTVAFDGTNPDAISYLWNDGDTNPVKQVSKAGRYKLAVMDRFCQRVYLDSVRVNITGIPKINLGNDTTMCKGETLTLRAEGGGITSARWDNGSSGPTLEVTNGGTYTVTVFNDCGSATDNITVDFIQCEPKPQFPNAFSPNGDGRNDVFRPIVRGPMFSYELRIFNRWGELIFLSADDHKGWDGKYKGSPVDVGTYVWWLTYKKAAGGSANIIKGEVTVIR